MEKVLNEHVIARLIGGQAEYRNPALNTLFRGEITEVNLRENELVIRFSWFAQLEKDAMWSACENSVSEIDLCTYSATLIGWATVLLESWEDPVIITLFPARRFQNMEAARGMLDPNKVRGLVLA